MTDKPMTLREGLQELTEQLREQGKMVVLLDAMLAQTAAADAERDRLAKIGELVEGLQGKVEIFSHYGGAFMVEPLRPDETPKTRTLLDALEALRAKTEGK